mmetsp:Transcript_56849/g.101440  ORF Transcript_56849/g.101440 Transcript_56849/m.101440 type:complete len:83 (-) Transcript_56849:146-394(-)
MLYGQSGHKKSPHSSLRADTAVPGTQAASQQFSALKSPLCEDFGVREQVPMRLGLRLALLLKENRGTTQSKAVCQRAAMFQV